MRDPHGRVVEGRPKPQITLDERRLARGELGRHVVERSAQFS
jgi:hypothetical protein